MNFVLKSIKIIAIFLLCGLNVLQGQQQCYTFDEFESGLRIGAASDDAPGLQIGEENGMIATAELFVDEESEFQFETLRSVDESFEPDFIHGQGLSIALNNISIKTDFIQTDIPHHLVQFHGFNFGGGFNLSINSEVSRFYTSLAEVPNFPFPGVTFESIEVPRPNGEGVYFVASLISEEPIQAITIGGENILIDNICYNPNPRPECRIFNPMNVPVCGSGDSLSVDLYLDHTLVNTNINVSLNGIDLGRRDFQNNIISIKNIGLLDSLPELLTFEFSSENRECTWSTVVRKPICDINNEAFCEISQVEVQLSLCDSIGDFYVFINFDTLAVNDSFDLRINTDFEERFSYADLPLAMLFNDSLAWVESQNLEWNITINDARNELCIAETFVEGNTLCGRSCNYSNLSIDDVICQTSFDSLSLSFSFDTIAPATDSFAVLFDNQFVGNFGYDQLPITNLPIKNSGNEIHSLTLFDFEGLPFPQSCQNTIHFPTPCRSCPADLITRLVAPPNENGNYTFEIDMIQPADTAGQFELFINEALIDTFRYRSLPIIRTFNCLDLSDTLNIAVVGLDTIGCSEQTFIIINCDSVCYVPEFQAEAFNCSSTNFDLQLAFGAIDNPVEVSVSLNGNLIGNSLLESELNFRNIPIQTSTDLFIEVCETGNPNEECCSQVTINNPCTIPQCEIEILEAVASSCDPEGMFTIDLEVNAENPLGTRFVVFVNGILQTSENYSSSTRSFELGPFDGTIQDNFRIEVFDVINVDCSASFELESPNCNPNPCIITNIQAEVVDCNDDNFSLSINFEHENEQSVFFDLWIDGENIGFFPYNTLPLRINNLSNDGRSDFNISVNDFENSDCIADFTLANTCNDCQINRFSVEPQACNNDQEFNFLVKAIVEATPTDTFFLLVNNQKFAELTFLDLPNLATNGVLIGGFDGSEPTNYLVGIQSNGFEFCQFDTTLQYECPPPPTCDISDLAFEVSDCDDDGNYFIEFNFEVENSIVDSFVLFVDGLRFNQFAYADLPIQIGPFFANGEQVNLNIRDLFDQDCGTNGQFIEENCIPPCEMRNLILQPTVCDDEGNYNLLVNVIVENSTSDFFGLYINGTLEGSYDYTDLPLSIGPFLGDDQNIEVSLRDGGDLNCRIDGNFNAPFCPLPCEISNLIVQPQVCDTDGNFLLDFNFDIENPVSDSFQVLINGAEISTFSYNQTRRTIGPFSGNGSILNISISDKGDLNCNITNSFQSPDCVVIECQLWAFSATALDCNDNQQFEVEIDFNHADESEQFELFQNGTSLGSFQYINLPITIGVFDGDGSQLNFEIIDSEDSECTLQGSLRSPECVPPCDLSGLSIRQNRCDENGNFTFELSFFQSFASDSFNLELIGANGFVEKYAYLDLPITVPSLPGDDITNYAFSIYDSEDTDCRLDFSVLAVDCLCEISNITASATSCDDNQNYSINLDFDFKNPGNSFLIEGNGYAQTFNYEDLPLIFGSFPGDNQIANYTITDQSRNDCNAQFSVVAPNCVPPCKLENSTIVEIICNNQGMFDAVIDFEHSNTGSAFMVNNQVFSYVSLPVRIGPFIGDGITTQNLTITDLDNSDCQLPFEIPANFCGDNCNITNLNALVSPCDEFGNFDLQLEFDFDNTNQSGFLVTVNGIPVGSFSYNIPQPISLGSFAGDNFTTYSIALLDLDDAQCNAATTIGPINCLPCEFSDLSTTITDCDIDGNFSVWVNFENQNGGNSGFSIRGNGVNYGSFSYADLPVQIGPFEGNGTSVFEFEISDNNDSNCAASTSVGPVECETENCRIFNLSAIPSMCESDGTFDVELRFDFEDIGESGFTVRGNGMVYGLFDYNDVPIRLGPFEGDGNTEYEFIVVDNELPDCVNFTSIGSIDCNETDCTISNLRVDLGDCNGDGTYIVTVDFEIENPISSAFELHSPRGLFGTYDLSELPLTIPDFEINGNPFDAVRVCLTGSHTCCASTFFPTPDCDGDCVEFDALPAGQTFDLRQNLIDTVIFENDVLVSTNLLFGENGTIERDSVVIETSSEFFDASFGVQLTTYNSTVKFNFPDFTSTPCREVTINYFQEGTFNNISINGQPTRIFSNFEDLPLEISTGVLAEIFPTNSREGTIRLKGFIRDIRIGGERLSLDNICYNECETTTSVWPGDINLDNLVSNLDILNLGVAYGSQGPARDQVSTNWEEQPADDWLRFFGRFQNYKHGDCNGDGIIDMDDLQVVDGNYGEFNEPIINFPPELPPVSAPRMYIDFPDPTTIEPNTPFTMRLMVAEEDNQVFNLYGLAFNLRYDQEQLQILNIKYPPGWYGEQSDDLIAVDRIFGNEGLAHVGMSRINQENVTGFGVVAELDGIIIVEDIVQRQGTTDIEIDGIVSINKDELTVPINGSVSTLDFTISSTEEKNNSKIEVYPNPTNDLIYFNSEGNRKVNQIEIYGTGGKLIETIIPSDNSISIEDYVPGIYTLKIRIEENVYYDRIIKQ